MKPETCDLISMFNPFKLLDPKPKPEEAEISFAGYQRDPFAAVPVKNQQAKHREDGDACYQIRMRLEPKPGLGGRLSTRLGLHRDVRVDLDQHGSYFWSQIDGTQDLRSIEGKIREKFSLAPEESEKATIMFTKMLMLRQLIQLKIES